MTRHWGHAGVILAAIAAAVWWPLTTALPPRDALQARIASAVVAVLACALFASWRSLRGRAAIAISVASALIGLALLIEHFNALDACLVDFEGRQLIIGSVYTPEGAGYVRDDLPRPGLLIPAASGYNPSPRTRVVGTLP